jgi:hypothetical protein
MYKDLNKMAGKYQKGILLGTSCDFKIRRNSYELIESKVLKRQVGLWRPFSGPLLTL